MRVWSVAVMVLWSVAAAVEVGAGAGGLDEGGETRGAQLVGPQIRVSGALATDDERHTAVAHNPAAGEHLVVWVDARNLATHGYEIYGQRIDASGQRIGGNVLISGPSATVDVEGPPGVAYNTTTNQYLVVWEDGRNYLTRGWDVYGQRIGAAGNRVGGSFRISGAAALADEYGPAVVFNTATGQYLVAWEDGRNTTTRGWDVYGQRVSVTGGRIGGNFRISGPAAAGNEFGAHVAYNSAGNQYLVVWHDDRTTTTGDSDIYGQRVTATGSRVGGNFRISGPMATAGEYSPSVAYNPAGNQYLVVWRDDRSTTTRGPDIFGQRVTATGSRVGGNFRISGALATALESNPAVAYHPSDNRYLVVWLDKRDYATRGTEIFGQRITAAGARVGGNLRISRAGAVGDELYPVVVSNPAEDQYLVVWEDSRDAATRGSDIYGQRVAG
jgi:hypothetical protein